MRYKFRAWDKIAKCMFEVSQIYFDKHNYFIWDKCGNEYRTNYELMQYTVLKDKNGKEIYEGDIIKFKNPQNQAYIKAVEYEEDSFGVTGYYLTSLNKIEIIGNIHEDKHLLEVAP